MTPWETRVRNELESANVNVESIEVRTYPNELIVVVYVPGSELVIANQIASRLDKLFIGEGLEGFVTIKESKEVSRNHTIGRVHDLSDSRVGDLVNLLSSRSRATEFQPSLSYIRDARDNLATALSRRHHLIFGRRGTGKTSLLVETKSLIEKGEGLTTWTNIQTFRHCTSHALFLNWAQSVCDKVSSSFAPNRLPVVARDGVQLSNAIGQLLSLEVVNQKTVEQKILPQMQRLVKRLTETKACPLFCFFDDFHYLARSQQPKFLDLVHGAIRDTNAWLKVAAIEHLARWFEPSTQMGLQSGHDSATIDLDLTLQDPQGAKLFLEEVLTVYARQCKITSISQLFVSNGALDRLVLASGAVPRDYLTLCSESIQEAKNRSNSRSVGMQDINKATSDAKQRKLSELEDDAASETSESAEAILSLNKVRAFCIDEKNWTYFRIDFHDKELLSDAYSRLQVLADLRFVHLVESSVSDEHRPGHRAEVYMLDLSQFAAHRLRRQLNVLELQDGKLALRKTGKDKTVQVGKTSNQRLSILRRCPVFPLNRLPS